jgi:hypothetical protein
LRVIYRFTVSLTPWSRSVLENLRVFQMVNKFPVLSGRDHAEEGGADRKIILECIVEKYDGKVWIGFM